MTLRPGRLALLERAASNAPMSNTERETLIRLGAPDHDREHVLTTLRQVAEYRRTDRRPEARDLIATLLDPPPTKAAPDA